MGFGYDTIYGEKKYHIKYKDMFGNEHSVEGDADSKSEAERLFHRRFDNCEIIKVQTSEEWVEDVSSEIAKGLMKYIKNCFSGKKSIINSEPTINTKNINYNSKSFLRGLKKINEENERMEEMSKPDYEKMYRRYNI